MTGRHLHSVGEISAMLASRIEDLAPHLFPAGHRDRHEWRVGSLAGEPGQSLGINLRGRPGVWKDFSGGEAGDALDLVAAAQCGGDLRAALIWARAWLGLSSAALPEGKAPAVQPKAADPERNEDGYRQKARALWLGGRPLAGSMAATYLAGRGLGDLPFVPGALRFRPDCWCSERRVNAPAMVACVVRGSRIIACHRTFLAAGPLGRVGKAPIAKAKKVLGAMKGGVIPLHRGASGRPLREACETDTTVICEGIEDGLTIALHMPEMRVLAAISAGNFPDLDLPPALMDIVFVFDRDGDNPAVARARQSGVEALLRQGRSVREVRPPEGFKDFNDWHQSLALRARQA